MPSTRRAAILAAPSLLLLLWSATLHAQDSPKVDQAWARPTVAGQAGGGGFLRVTGGSTPDRLLSARAPVAKVVELHTMEMDGNVMRMHAIDGGVDIPAGKTVELKPGGMHVMLMGLTQTLKAGASFPLTLHFAKAGDVTVSVAVQAAAPAAATASAALTGKTH